MNNENFPIELYQLIEEQLNLDEDLSAFVDEELLQDALSNPNLLDWSINQESFTLYFDEYEIAAGAAGAIQIDIPFQKIDALINDEIVKKLELTEEDVDQKDEDKEKVDEEVNIEPNGKYVALTFD